MTFHRRGVLIIALISCPECGKENVSQQAIACPNCGYGIKVHYETLKKQEELEKQELELKKQEEERIKEGVKSISMPTKPSFAAVAILIVFSLIAGTLVFMLIATRVENVIITLISVIISIIIIAIIIIKDYSDKIKDYNYASQNFKEYQKEQYKKRAAYVRSQAVNFITSKNKVQCPFCQSTNVVPISGVERVFSLIMLGRFSKKINKSFECDNCDGTF